jgi:hypothetical protein
MIAYGGTSDKRRSIVRQKRPRKTSFADPPWNDDDPLRLEIDARIPENHLLRQIAACSLRLRCTPKSKTGRTITRIEHEELAEALRARMATPEAKKIYQLRGQTIEQPFADVQENRGTRRFCRRGLRMARAQTAALVLCHNLLALQRGECTTESAAPITRILRKMHC